MVGIDNNPDVEVLMAQFVHIDASDAKHGSNSIHRQLEPLVNTKQERPDMDLSQMSEDILNLRASLLILAMDANIPAHLVLQLRAQIIDLNSKHDAVLGYLAKNLSDLTDECDNLALELSYRPSRKK